ncbi:protein kinase, putative [Trichomonas vaginalis G3]|uniref:Protein kinase, putative n=1 Tax=Trichomonas vaginalis (strain ATCC PRA-98 / G3) TaxID=412133 RepID=A2FZL4_TRIV3|nr:protein serine/threonine kinase protein [Trichomonas vaginalis G3]EAX89649.1 protein kinase, putative [Trichomonas vaginalis G3]KAI5498977.1 protein serine/threonine kinase protein [Trichomonas vaginalis G3]|eukprot:XP_001302579.1 protein kinase [Trichomonas vaginalis G3]
MEQQVLDAGKRYLRCELKQTQSRTKVYKCLDQEESIEAEWYEISLEGIAPEKLTRMQNSLIAYSGIKNAHLLQIFRAWVDSDRNTLIFIKELFSNKTLRTYIKEVSQIPAKACAQWCAQIMSGLTALHALNPPIIHNNISCDTIYIDASVGAVKLDTPSFESILFDWIQPTAALEAQQKISTPKSDVWSLGLAVIEISTGVIPYSDKTNPHDNILKGELPTALGQISDPSIADFATTCLLSFEQRPCVNQLYEYALISENYEPPKDQPVSSELEILDKKQKEEYQKLLARHEQERRALREKIKARKRKTPSMRDLLKELQ